MASIWKLGSVDVYVDEFSTKGDPKITKHTVLDAVGTSVLHFFGSGAREIQIGGHVFTETNRDTLEGYENNYTTVTLTSDQGNEGNFKIQELSFERVNAKSVHIAGIATDTTVYRFKAALLPT